MAQTPFKKGVHQTKSLPRMCRHGEVGSGRETVIILIKTDLKIFVPSYFMLK